ncbi:hypothetical protein GGQ84_001590 [Desulfitispora alkaliphila]
MDSNAMWKVFEQTGHLGAYVLYRDWRSYEEETSTTNQITRKVQANS